MSKRVIFCVLVSFIFALITIGCDDKDQCDCPVCDHAPGTPECQACLDECRNADDNPDPDRLLAMDFSCCRGDLWLDVYFHVSDEGCVKGVLGYVEPDDVEAVVFFIDGHDIYDCPSVPFDQHVTLDLPGGSVAGNLVLRLKDGTQVWADLGDSGHWEISGASRDGGYLVASCDSADEPPACEGSDCYCP